MEPIGLRCRPNSLILKFFVAWQCPEGPPVHCIFYPMRGPKAWAVWGFYNNKSVLPSVDHQVQACRGAAQSKYVLQYSSIPHFLDTAYVLVAWKHLPLRTLGGRCMCSENSSAYHINTSPWEAQASFFNFSCGWPILTTGVCHKWNTTLHIPTKWVWSGLDTRCKGKWKQWFPFEKHPILLIPQ